MLIRHWVLIRSSSSPKDKDQLSESYMVVGLIQAMPSFLKLLQEAKKLSKVFWAARNGCQLAGCIMHLHMRYIHNPVNSDTEQLHASHVYQCSCVMAGGCLPVPDSSTMGM